MKVFKFDHKTGTKGEFLGNFPFAHSMGNPAKLSAVTPKWADSEWMVASEAKDIKNKPISFDEPVCFCLGQWRAGEGESFWSWVALLPA